MNKIQKPLFELNNEQRKYLGLAMVEKTWQLQQLSDGHFIYFDGDIIRKSIIVSENSYLENELCEYTAENRTLLLPKTAKGKPKKLNVTASRSFAPFGVYFQFSPAYICIGNYTTQKTFYAETLESDQDIDFLPLWLNKWIDESDNNDLAEIEAFKVAKREYCKFNEGDFFAFKLDRRRWGFGRILINVVKLNKSNDFNKQKNEGLKSLMGKPLIVKVYHKISNSPSIDIEILNKCMALPVQAIMDNPFYYGEYKIIGNKPINIADYDEPMISYGKSIEYDSNAIYLQYGLIYKESNNKVKKYSLCDFKNDGIGFGLDTHNLEACIEQQSNSPFWKCTYYNVQTDLRNPINSEIKKDIFEFFGLDASKNYEQNLELANL